MKNDFKPPDEFMDLLRQLKICFKTTRIYIHRLRLMQSFTEYYHRVTNKSMFCLRSGICKFANKLLQQAHVG